MTMPDSKLYQLVIDLPNGAEGRLDWMWNCRTDE